MEKFKGQKDELNKKYGTYKNGTNYIRNINNDIMHQCQYCETWFLPNRRFIQKYCSESCRVSACRKRKGGLFGVVGGQLYDRSNVTNQTLVNQIQNQYKQVDELKEQIQGLRELVRDTHQITGEKLKNIKEKGNWNLVLATIMPFVAPYVRNRISEAQNNENKNAEDILKEFDSYASGFKDGMTENEKENMNRIRNAIASIV